jgi:hypothetical protein
VKTRAKLTEVEWKTVFDLRCQSKQGRRLHDDERALVERAFKEDPRRYEAMEPDVFDATVPFGSNVKAPRKEQP